MPPTLLRHLTALLLMLAGTSLAAAPFTALGDGERLVYRVGWGLFGNAGEISIAARAETSGEEKPLMRITLVTTTRGMVRGVYKFESTAEVLVERDTGRMLWSSEKGFDRSKPIENRTDFDYAANLARHRDTHRPGRNRDIVIAPGLDPVDLLSALVDTRSWQFKPGDARDIAVFAGRDIYPVTVHAEATETVETPLGKFPSLVLVPRMEKTPPRGIFAKGGDIKVWLSQNGAKLPVKMQLHLNFGQATLVLTQHTPPKN